MRTIRKCIIKLERLGFSELELRDEYSTMEYISLSLKLLPPFLTVQIMKQYIEDIFSATHLDPLIPQNVKNAQKNS